MPRTSDLRIAVLPGDGIGVEVMDVCIEVLECLAKQLDLPRFAWNKLPGGAMAYRENGTALSEAAMNDSLTDKPIITSLDSATS